MVKSTGRFFFRNSCSMMSLKHNILVWEYVLHELVNILGVQFTYSSVYYIFRWQFKLYAVVLYERLLVFMSRSSDETIILRRYRNFLVHGQFFSIQALSQHFFSDVLHTDSPDVRIHILKCWIICALTIRRLSMLILFLFFQILWVRIGVLVPLWLQETGFIARGLV